mmetsp:Transcript_78407/g.187984  ORF Transcript_78407/g.187984 Transcript_78407/m.187984 type:complete len:226 (-) Transcript_78407:614-1291(-)
MRHRINLRHIGGLHRAFQAPQDSEAIEPEASHHSGRAQKADLEDRALQKTNCAHDREDNLHLRVGGRGELALLKDVAHVLQQDVDEHREEAEHAKGLEEEFTPGHACNPCNVVHVRAHDLRQCQVRDDGERHARHREGPQEGQPENAVAGQDHAQRRSQRAHVPLRPPPLDDDLHPAAKLDERPTLLLVRRDIKLLHCEAFSCEGIIQDLRVLQGLQLHFTRHVL